VKLLVLGLLFPLACAASDVVTGAVAAPGGKLALERGFFFGAAHAHIPGLRAVAGATVELIDTRSGGALASGTTESRGVYTFPAPAGFQPGPRYMVRATGAGHRLEAFVTALRTNIDPATDATAKLIIQHANLARLRTAEVQEVLPLIQHLAWEVDTPAAHNGAALATMLRTAATNDEEIFNIIASIGAAGEIHGRVTDGGKKPLARVTILARDASTRTTRAVTHSDAQGRYRLRVLPGEYTIDAINETASTAASEPGATAIKVGAGSVERNFSLGAGGRVSGTVMGIDGSRLTGIRVRLRDAGTGQSLVDVRTRDDGGYRLNMMPGAYVLVAENTTLQPFASSLGGMRVDVERGGELTADLKLPNGRMISGSATPASSVRVEDAETQKPAAVLRANRAGEYRLWVLPGRYAAR
jgi:Carboxypeptidase regulatory-like domain